MKKFFSLREITRPLRRSSSEASRVTKSTILGLTFGILLAGYAVFAFDPPTVAPPGGNVPAPINVGSDSQVKSGGLWVGSLGVDGGATFGGTVQIGNSTTSLPCGSAKKGAIYFNTNINKISVCTGVAWEVFSTGVDFDGDGVFAGIDCDDGDASIWRNLTGYRDTDSDTYTTGSEQNICSGSSLPSGWRSSSNGNDCNDANTNVFQNIANLVTDADQDGYATSAPAGTKCVGVSTTVSGRTYYNDTSNSFNWLVNGHQLFGTDLNDSNAGIGAGGGIFVTKSATLSGERFGHSVTNPSSNIIFIAGGAPLFAEQYNVSSNSVTTKASFPGFRKARGGTSCAADSSTGKTYCFAGGGDNSIVEYDPGTNTWTIKSATYMPVGGHSCVENSETHKIYCFGGRGDFVHFSQNVWEYVPSTDTMTRVSTTNPMSASTNMSCVENSSTHKIYCLGGTGNFGRNEIVEYDPATNTGVIKSATLPVSRGGLGCAENPSTNRIYCFGGRDGHATFNDIYEYNPATDTIRVLSTTLPSQMSDLECVNNSANNKIYCVLDTTIYEYTSP